MAVEFRPEMGPPRHSFTHFRDTKQKESARVMQNAFANLELPPLGFQISLLVVQEELVIF